MAQRHFLSLKDWSREEIELLFEESAAIKAEPGELRDRARRASRSRIDLPEAVDAHPRVVRGGHVPARRAGAVPRARTTSSSTAARRSPTPRACCRATCTGSWPASSRTRTSSTSPGTARCPSSTASPTSCTPARRSPTTSRCASGAATSTGLKMAYVGDGNNVCHELMFGAVKLGVQIAHRLPERATSRTPLVDKSAVREAQKLGTPLPEVDQRPAWRRWRARTSSTPTCGPRWGRRRRPRARRRVRRATRSPPEMMAVAGPRGRLHALPACPPRRGGGGRGHRRAAVGRLRRGREPPARPEGRPRHA